MNLLLVHLNHFTFLYNAAERCTRYDDRKPTADSPYFFGKSLFGTIGKSSCTVYA